MASSETISVRPDEQFDEAKVAAYLKDKLPGADQPMTVKQFPGGAANLTYLLQFGDEHEYVLRRPPLGKIAPKSHDMEREYNVLSRLYEVFPVAPRAFHFCADAELIGAPFLIMERRQGLVVRTDMPQEYKAFPNAARQMSATLMEQLAAFHAVDYAAIGLGALGKPEGFLLRQVEGWYGRWEKAKVDELPIFDQVYEWLTANIPAESAHSLVHNDYKLDNTMFDPQDPSKMIAIFDWDMCTLGDPLNDVGTVLAYWTEPNDPPFYRGLLGMPDPEIYDFMSRQELVDQYANASGRDVSHIQFYHVLAIYRLVVIVAQIYIRYHRGQTQDERFAAFKDIMPVLAQNAHDLTQKV